MKVDMIQPPLQSSFLAAEKDMEEILKKLFVENKEYSKELVKLLTINTKDCLDNKTNPEYKKMVEQANLSYLIKEGYIKIVPRAEFSEHAEEKSFIMISFDNYLTNSENHMFRDCTVSFDIICPLKHWDMGDYRLRPLKIAGCIDGILNRTRLSGLGTFNFLTCNEIVFDKMIGGYSMTYHAIHGSDDWIAR